MALHDSLVVLFGREQALAGGSRRREPEWPVNLLFLILILSPYLRPKNRDSIYAAQPIKLGQGRTPKLDGSSVYS